MEKSRAVQGQIRYLLSGDYELTNKNEINNHLYMFYKSLFTENKKLSETQITYFLDEISNFPKLTSKRSNDCEAPLSESFMKRSGQISKFIFLKTSYSLLI